MEGEDIREGFDPSDKLVPSPPELAVSEDDDEPPDDGGPSSGNIPYGSFGEERDVWDSAAKHL